ncbi:MAG: hypothetical protein KGL39_53455 [Patescibacteria group bacterium]|nr:hypothetical protein [Patescibacteria group bacterium]
MSDRQTGAGTAQPPAHQNHHAEAGQTPFATLGRPTDPRPIARVRQFRYDPINHIYTLDDEVIPGVTNIIKPLFGDWFDRIDPATLEHARERGKRVHRLTELHDQGIHVRPAEDDEVVPYLHAWWRFRAEMRPRIFAIEQSGYHPTLEYGGTNDRLVIIDGYAGVLDIKTSAELMPQTAIQTMGYALIEAAKDGTRPWRRWAVQLKPTGEYRLERYRDDPYDESVFRACLRVHRHGDRQDGATLMAWETINQWRRAHAA